MNSTHLDISILVLNINIIQRNIYLFSYDEIEPWFNTIHNNKNNEKCEIAIVNNKADKKELNNLIKIHNDKLKKRKVNLI